jgi:hypothetical protein
MKAAKKAPVKKAKKAPAKPKEPKVKEVIVRWDMIDPIDGDLYGLLPSTGQNKKAVTIRARLSNTYSEVVRVTIERFEK